MRKRIWTAITGLLIATCAVVAAKPSYLTLERGAIRDFGGPKNAPIAVTFFSGDMGFRSGMNSKIAEALVARGIPVMGFSSIHYFERHRTRAEADAIVTNALRQTMARTGTQRVILLGRSYGADIVATVTPDLPADLRSHVAAVALLVPGQSVYFRADPLGIAYLGKPDAKPLATLSAFRDAPIVCIYGEEEDDSLCPPLADAGAHVQALPGGHFLKHDNDRVISSLMNELHAAVPAIAAEPDDMRATAS